MLQKALLINYKYSNTTHHSLLAGLFLRIKQAILFVFALLLKPCLEAQCQWLGCSHAKPNAPVT